MARCEHCGRPTVNDRQMRHWAEWADHRYRRRQPWWWRWSFRCLGWYDCTPEWIDVNPDAANWWIRRCYRKTVTADA